MFVGALIGALLALDVDTAAALGAAAAVLAIAVIAAFRVTRTDAAWVRYRG